MAKSSRSFRFVEKGRKERGKGARVDSRRRDQNIHAYSNLKLVSQPWETTARWLPANDVAFFSVTVPETKLKRKTLPGYCLGKPPSAESQIQRGAFGGHTARAYVSEISGLNTSSCCGYTIPTSRGRNPSPE